MAKFIAIWGSPDSGKTTFSTKLAKTIYDEYQSTVIVVYADNETPALPILFPNRRKEDIYSLGVILSKTDITQDDIIKQIVTIKGCQNFGVLGFSDGENKYTYPAFDETKVRTLFNVLSTLADYIIIDCTSNLSNSISRYAIKAADEVIRLATPDLKSISYYASQLQLYADPIFRLNEHIQGINVPDEDLYMPIEDAKAHLQDLSFTLPYSRAVKQQMLDGKLFASINDKKYNDKLKQIVNKIV